MGGEDSRVLDDAHRLFVGPALFDQARDASKRGERGMALVQVIYRWMVVERLEGEHSADTEQDLLPHARVILELVESFRELAILLHVSFAVCIEQKKCRTADLHLPYSRDDISFPEWTRDVDSVSSRGIFEKSYPG